MSARVEALHIRGHPDAAPRSIGFKVPVPVEARSREEFFENVFENEENPVPCEPWVPRLQKFTVIVCFKHNPNSTGNENIRSDYFIKTLKESVKCDQLAKIWRKDPQHEHLCNLNFSNVIVKRISLANKSTAANFNASLKIFDNAGACLYNPIPLFGSVSDGTVINVTGSEQTLDPSGTPLWGDQQGFRIVYENCRRPDNEHMVYANFKVETLTEGSKNLEYEIPVKDRRKSNATQTMRLTHVMKNPCARFFEWALAQQNDVYSPGFTESPAHAVAGMPHMFCINTDDYHKVIEAFTEKKKSIGTHDISAMNIVLEFADQVIPGAHSFQLDFEVWMASQDCDIAFPEDSEIESERN